MTTQATWWERLRNSSLFWPLVALALVMLIQPVFHAQLFSPGDQGRPSLWQPGRCAQPRRAADADGDRPDNAVIATGGVDLSVGAVAAICAAVATRLIGNVTDVTNTPLPLVIVVTLAVAIAVRAVEWAAGLARQHPADGGDAGADGGRARHCPTHHRRADHHRLLSPFFYFGAGYLLGLPFTLFIVAPSSSLPG
jgi:hypothetical protein